LVDRIRNRPERFESNQREGGGGGGGGGGRGRRDTREMQAKIGLLGCDVRSARRGNRPPCSVTPMMESRGDA
jgi:hypothetical protein